MTPLDKHTDAELLEIAKAAAADFVSSTIAEAPESECPPGLLTARYNIWGEYRQVDGSTDESRIASGLGDVDAAFFATFNPARVISLLERLQAAEAAREDFDDLFREYSLTLSALSTSEASRLSVEGERARLKRVLSGEGVLGKMVAAILDELEVQNPDAQRRDTPGEIWLSGGCTPQSAGCVIDADALASSALSALLSLPVGAGEQDSSLSQDPGPHPCGSQLEPAPMQGAPLTGGEG